MIFAVASLKGGAAKTTTAVALAMALRERGAKVLLVDLDPQATATLWMGKKTSRALADWFRTRGAKKLDSLVEGDMIVSGPSLAEVPGELNAKAAPDFVLGRGLRPLARDWDYVLIDCPPGDNRLTSNAIYAADRMLVPVQPGSIDGLISLLALTREWGELTPGASIAELGGIVLARAKATNLAEKTAEWLRKRYRAEFLEPVVPDTVAVQQAWHDRHPLAGPVGGRATEAYGRIADLLLKRSRRVRK